jgi:hypothetical protein
MSVDPAAINAAASSVSANTAAIEALIQAELDALAADAQALQNQVTTGQVVTAQVLPSNGLTDLISILGSRVAAQLPPGIMPGDTFTAQVTGFNGPQILLQVLTAAEQAIAAAAPPPGLATAAQPPPTPLQAAAARPPLPAGVTPSVAPPPAVFVAASVRPAPGPQAPPPSAQPAPQQALLLADIEARLAAARAGQVVVNVPTSGPLQAPPVPAPQGLIAASPPATAAAPSAPLPAAATPATPAPSPAAPQPVQLPGRFALPPQIAASPLLANASPASSNTNAAPAPPTAVSYQNPQALVRALGLAVTPTNLAAAKLALNTPQRLPAALATLESALPSGSSASVDTLRTLIAFIGKISPQSPQLAAQISAYVGNVVTGNEPKLAQLLSAQFAAGQAANAPPPPPSGVPGAAAAPAAGSALPAAPFVPTLPALALAQAAERTAALNVDLKTQILALVNAPPAGDHPVLAPAASAALSAISAVQLNAAQALAATPQTMAFSIPMFLGQGYAQARIAIDRDAPQPGGSRSLDGDNFHIAFVLDTKNLGTVAVDLQTVGRAFSLSVKTQNEKSAQRFGEALGRLTDRLETLRYRVNSAEAGVAPRGMPATAAAAQPAELADDGVQSDVNVRA